MNHSQTYLTSEPSHISTGPPYGAQSQTTGGMSQYPPYHQQPSMQSGPGAYGSAHAPYSTSYYGGLTSPQSANRGSASTNNHQLTPLSTMGMVPQQNGQYGNAVGPAAQGYSHSFDSTGQIPPPGVKPRVTATLWEDEGSLCFQVESKGVCVARREDNHMINGTKLLNVAGMTRGRRDGILKSEKTRHVVKIGPMHLKGVWIPFERALDFANKEKITELLYPLFVHNIGALLYHPTNSSRTNLVMEAAKQRRIEGNKSGGGMMAGAPGSHPAGIQHHHSMSGGMPSQVGQMQHSIAPHPGSVRPNMDRAHTFPTPPTSASSIIGGSNGSSYDWSAQNMGTGVQNPSQPLAIETGLANNRSMPSTPATTPPSTAGMHNNMQGYPAQQSYDTSRAMYSTAPQAQGQYATQQQNLARFSQPGQGSYMRNDMGPPSRANGEAEQPEIKQDPYGQGQGNEQVTENDHEGEGDYSQDANAAYNASRGSYTYGASSSMNGMPGDHAHMSQDSVNGSPHQNGSGRATPRTSSSQPQWAAGYNTPPRTATSSSLYSVSSLTNGHSDVYGSYPAVNGTSNKRGRDDDDDYKSGADIESLKRRRSGREGSISAPMPAYNHAQSSTIIRSGGRR